MTPLPITDLYPCVPKTEMMRQTQAVDTVTTLRKKNITRKKLNNKGERGQKTIQETEWEQKIIGAEEQMK